jgi:hypothetical protein
MRKKPDPGSEMNIPDLMFKSSVLVFGLKILKVFDAAGILSNLDLESGMEKIGSGILDPG